MFGETALPGLGLVRVCHQDAVHFFLPLVTPEERRSGYFLLFLCYERDITCFAEQPQRQMLLLFCSPITGNIRALGVHVPRANVRISHHQRLQSTESL